MSFARLYHLQPCAPLGTDHDYADIPNICNPSEYKHAADKFMERWNFPNTCGAIDGKHVNCKCPPNSGSLYYNYKRFYSVVLIALVDADYKFIWADTGVMGSASYAEIYNASKLKECIEDGSLGSPDLDLIPKDNQV